MAVAAVLAGTALLLVKGLYPQGGHDYYQHYSHFYAAVIDSHGIWPNLFWYEYYLLEGHGPDVPGHVAHGCPGAFAGRVLFCRRHGIGAVLVGSRLRVKHLVAVAGGCSVPGAQRAYVGDGTYFANGGWGHFQKPHELNSPLMFAVLWMSVSMVRSAGAVRRVWWLSASLCAFVAAYVLLVSPLILGLFAVLAALYFFAKSRQVSWMFLGVAVSTGVGLVSLLLLNYLTTGAPADVAPNVWWPIVDLRRLSDEGMLFDFVNIAAVRARGAVDGSVLTGDFSLIEYVVNVFRFDILGILIGAALLGWLASMLCPRRPVPRVRRQGRHDR